MFISEEAKTLVRAIRDKLLERGETLAVSESCCGGLIASYLVSEPGATDFFVGGTTTYALRSRLRLSGWTMQDVESYTGPSEEVAVRLARNLRLELGATYALGETGWAGPASADRPDQEPGSVFLGVSGAQNQQSTSLKTGLSDRTANMERFAEAALQFLLGFLESA